jgi:hypothetical protein
MDDTADTGGAAGNSKTFVPAKRDLSSEVDQAQLGSSEVPSQAQPKKPRKTVSFFGNHW